MKKYIFIIPVVALFITLSVRDVFGQRWPPPCDNPCGLHYQRYWEYINYYFPNTVYRTPTTLASPTKQSKLIVYYVAKNSRESRIVKLEHNGYLYLINIDSGVTQKRVDPNIQVAAGERVTLREVQESGSATACSPPSSFWPQDKAVGWIDVGSDLKCGSGWPGPPATCPLFSRVNVGSDIAWAESFGYPLVSKQCWGDSMEWYGDYDFEDFFIMFSYEPVSTPTPTPKITPTPTPTITPTPIPQTCGQERINITGTLSNINDTATITAFTYPNPLTPAASQTCLTISNGSSLSFTSGNNCVPGNTNSRVVKVISTGTANLRATGSLVNGTNCPSEDMSVIIAEHSSWWQVVNADVWMRRGNLGSELPIPPVGIFERPTDLLGNSVIEGIPVYVGVSNFGSGKVSNKGWIAKTGYGGSEYDYSYFVSRIPGEVTPVQLTDSNLSGAIASATPDQLGYKWIRKDLSLTIDSELIVGNEKVVVFVNGDLNINKKITLNKNQGFFMAIVSGDINVGPAVANLEGVYLTDKLFMITSAGSGLDSQLLVRGTVIAWNNIVLSRDLPDNTQPGEIFQFAPDQFLRIPPTFGKRQTTTKEITP